MELEFTPWPKIPRIKSNEVTITEKIDGTNAAIIIQNGKLVGCQSRKRLITPDDDNMGFARWAFDNKYFFEERMCDGTHFGEWAGPGIQKNPHNLERKTFFLFNTFKWKDLYCVKDDLTVVPILYEGQFNDTIVYNTMVELKRVADLNGYEPEGVIIYYHDLNTYQKATFKNPEGKWAGV